MFGKLLRFVTGNVIWELRIYFNMHNSLQGIKITKSNKIIKNYLFPTCIMRTSNTFAYKSNMENYILVIITIMFDFIIYINF